MMIILRYLRREDVSCGTELWGRIQKREIVDGDYIRWVIGGVTGVP